MLEAFAKFKSDILAGKSASTYEQMLEAFETFKTNFAEQTASIYEQMLEAFGTFKTNFVGQTASTEDMNQNTEL